MGAKRVLIIDNDADSRAVYRILLEHRGYEVLEAETAASGHAQALAQRVSLVVTELTLRHEDGYALIEQLRADERTRDVCVVVVTARALREDEDRTAELGCALFLVKPVEPNVLANEIDQLMKKR